MPTRLRGRRRGPGRLAVASPSTATTRRYGTGRFAADLGDRLGAFAFRLSYNHLDSHAQPLTYATADRSAARPARPERRSPAPSPTPTATASPIVVLGSTAIEHQVQDNLSGRVDLRPDAEDHRRLHLRPVRTTTTTRRSNSYLRDASGQPVYAGGVNIAGRAYTAGQQRLLQRRLSPGRGATGPGPVAGLAHRRGLRLRPRRHRASTICRAASGSRARALPAAFAGGAGSTTALDGTGWHTLDASGTWRPQAAPTCVTFGAHEDGFRLDNPKYALTDWIDGSPGAIQSLSAAAPRPRALWAQDAWTLTPDAEGRRVGGRYEHWRAYDGLNFSVSPALERRPAELQRRRLLAQGGAGLVALAGWTFKGSVGLAYRFPTVTELYQAVTVGDPVADAQPEPEARTGALQRALGRARLVVRQPPRLGLRRADPQHPAVADRRCLPSGASASFVQNVDRTHATGVELVADRRDVLVPGLELSGWVTYVDARIDRDAAFPAAVGKDLPQLPPAARRRGRDLLRATPEARSDAGRPLQRPRLRHRSTTATPTPTPTRASAATSSPTPMCADRSHASSWPRGRRR